MHVDFLGQCTPILSSATREITPSLASKSGRRACIGLVMARSPLHLLVLCQIPERAATRNLRLGGPALTGGCAASAPRPMTSAHVPDLRSSCDASRRYRTRREAARADGEGRIDALLVPRADEHQGEYVPPLGGAPQVAHGIFGLGRAGAWSAEPLPRCSSTAAMSCRRRTQVDTRIFEVLQIPRPNWSEWLGKHVKSGGLVGFDPWLHTAAMIEELAKALKPKGIKLRAAPATRWIARGAASGPPRRTDPLSRIR